MLCLSWAAFIGTTCKIVSFKLNLRAKIFSWLLLLSFILLFLLIAIDVTGTGKWVGTFWNDIIWLDFVLLLQLIFFVRFYDYV